MEKVPSQQEIDHKHSQAIHVSLDIEANFKLYSYRIISQEVFIARVTELCDFFLTQTKSK